MTKKKRQGDFLDELVAQSTRRHRDFPELVDVAYQQAVLGHDLARKRQRLGLTQADVAHRMGSTQRIVSKIENGGDVQVSTLRRYVMALGQHLNIKAVARPSRPAASSR